MFPKYNYREAFSTAFLKTSPIQRARKLRGLYDDTFELTSKCRQFDDPSKGFVAKTRERIESVGENAFLEDFQKFAYDSKKLFASAREMFSADEIEFIFNRHKQLHNTLENMIHRLYFTTESYFAGLERLENTQTITPKWREIFRKYREA